ncbi:autotransporter assembly complex protein TamA [Thalassotalea agarivorans]|uniref:Translocation and assembly module subunit TamA n=1 Tax=Thalassotalea agarivorans TaxID=349064 RepID=A0A1H9YFA7_THASX|nr:outer membrane protein assembly factor [Thalassotalea agarivorans]SES67580.1 autotransporter secretion outer membrane protein TamA [Thalassotalea agarivorans]
MLLVVSLFQKNTTSLLAKLALLFALLLISPLASADDDDENIVVELPEDLPDPIADNIMAHLGELPTTPEARTNFIFSAEGHAENALRALGYYRSAIDTKITKDKEDDEWTLTFFIVLNQPTVINQINIELVGEAKQDPAFTKLLTELPVKEGDTLNHGLYEQIKSKLTSLALEHGYFDAKFEKTDLAIIDTFIYADINIIFNAGNRYYFGETFIQPFDIEPWLLESLIPYEVGEPYTTQQLFRFQNNLQQTRYFNNTMVVPDKANAQDYQLPINVDLLKNKVHYFDVGFGWSTDTEYRVSTGWRTPLVNRYGHSQETKIEYSQVNPTGRFTYRIPWTHPLNDIIQFQVLLEDDEYGDLEGKSFEVKLSNIRKFGAWNAQIYLRFLKELWKFNEEEIDLGEYRVNTLNVWDDPRVTLNAYYFFPGITITRVKREGNPLDPSWGYLQYYNIEGASDKAASELTVFRAIAKWKLIVTPISRHRFVFRLEAGANYLPSDPKTFLAPSLRFYVGGDQSLRGFDYQSQGPSLELPTPDGGTQTAVVGGKYMLVGSAEYQYYFTEKFRTALFTDIGNAMDTIEINPLYSVGTGLHYISPIGAIRLDFGYSISEEDPDWKIHFSFGAEL